LAFLFYFIFIFSLSYRKPEKGPLDYCVPYSFVDDPCFLFYFIFIFSLSYRKPEKGPLDYCVPYSFVDDPDRVQVSAIEIQTYAEG
jgi:hypothetical protein